jgi:hypothetical protein
VDSLASVDHELYCEAIAKVCATFPDHDFALHRSDALQKAQQILLNAARATDPCRAIGVELEYHIRLVAALEIARMLGTVNIDEHLSPKQRF